MKDIKVKFHREQMKLFNGFLNYVYNKILLKTKN